MGLGHILIGSSCIFILVFGFCMNGSILESKFPAISNVDIDLVTFIEPRRGTHNEWLPRIGDLNKNFEPNFNSGPLVDSQILTKRI